MQLIITLALALLLVALPAESQAIRGKVLEDDTGAPIAGAAVELVAVQSGRTITTETDTTGAFLLVPGGSGQYRIRLRHIAYQALDAVMLDVGPAEAIEIEVRMGRMVIPIEPLTVTARRRTRMSDFHERRERNVGGRFMTRDEIERRGSHTTSELLRMMPGVTLTPTGLGTDQLITMRGGGTGRCLATVYIDGLHFEQHPGIGVDAMLTPEMIEGVEVYSSSALAPSPLNAHGSCGVVAFWTRGGVPGARWTWRRLAIAFVGVGVLLFLAN